MTLHAWWLWNESAAIDPKKDKAPHKDKAEKKGKDFEPWDAQRSVGCHVRREAGFRCIAWHPAIHWQLKHRFPGINTQAGKPLPEVRYDRNATYNAYSVRLTWMP